MKKIRSFFEIFFIVILVKAAIIVALILTPLTVLVGISLIIWYFARFVRTDLAEMRSEMSDETDEEIKNKTKSQDEKTK